MAHTEAWLQGHYDAYNFLGYNPGGYNAAEYLAGWNEGIDRLK